MGHSRSKAHSRHSHSPDCGRSSPRDHHSPHRDRHSPHRNRTSRQPSGRNSFFGIGSKHNQERSPSSDREQLCQFNRDKPKRPFADRDNDHDTDKPKRVLIDKDYESDIQPSRNPNKKQKLDQKPSADDDDDGDDVEDRISLTEEQKRRKRVEQLNLVLVEGEIIKANAGRKVEKGYVSFA